MTDKDKDFLKRINDYAEKVLADIDPQKTQVSVQLEALKPILTELAAENNMDLTDAFIKYMDLQTEASAATDKKMQDSLKDLNDNNDGMPLLYR